MSRYSFIDHFIVSTAVYDSFLDNCYVRHDGDNLSDHDPIMMRLHIDWNAITAASRHHTNKRRPIWYKASGVDLTAY